MQFTTAVAVLLTVGMVSASPTICMTTPLPPATKSYIETAFASASVVPDIIPSIDPQIVLEVSFGDHKVDLGNTFLTNETTNKPTFTLPAAPYHPAGETNYTIIILDPDIPEQGKAPALHYLAYDYQPSCVMPQHAPQESAPFIAFTPIGANPHRYTFLAYLQVQEPAVHIGPNISDRFSFDLLGFVQENKLQLVGGNFLRESADSTS